MVLLNRAGSHRALHPTLKNFIEKSIEFFYQLIQTGENFSIKKLIAGSISEIDEVIAAKKSKIKNRVATMVPPGIAPKAIGRVSKIRPGPAVDGSRL